MARPTRRLIKTRRRGERILRAAVLPLAIVLGATLGGCANGHAHSLAHEACGYVTNAEHLLSEAGASSSAPSQAKSLRHRAEGQLELAEPIAAQAAGDDPAWEALQATLQEVGTVPVPVIMPALRADCASPNGDD